MDFSDGMNVINEENGWGKTTLAVFLKAMLYGLDARREPGAYDRERGMYRPWQGGIFGGTLDFETGGRSYRISRTFGKTEKTDEFHLYDLSTMLESGDFSANIGVELFDLDSASFKRSIFIGQNDCTCTSTDSINAKLGNLAENTNDINNYESACIKLKDALNHLSPNRVTGSIKRRRQLMEQLGVEIKSLTAAEEGYVQLQELYHAKEQEKEQLTQTRQQQVAALQQVSRESALQEKRAQYEALLTDARQLGETCRNYQSRFPAGVPGEEDLRRLTGTVRQMAETEASIRTLDTDEEGRQDYERLGKRFADGVPDKAVIAEYMEKQHTLASGREQLAAAKQQEQELRLQLESESAAEEAPKKASWPVGSVIGVLLIVAAFLGLGGAVGIRVYMSTLSLARYAPAIGFMFAGAMCILSSVFFQMGRKQKEKKQKLLDEEQKEKERREDEKLAPLTDLKERIAGLERQIAEQEEQIGEFLASCHQEAQPEQFVPALYELSNETERFARLQQTQDALTEAREDQQALQAQVDAFAQQYRLQFGEDIASELTDIQTRAAEYRIAKQSYERALWKLQQFEAQNDTKRLLEEKQSGDTLEGVNASIHEIDTQLDAAREAMEQYHRQMEQLQQQMDLKADREEELRRNQSLQEEEAHRYEILECTQEFLRKAKESFTAQYMAPISDGFRKYYGMLAESAQEEWQINANIQLQIRQAGQMREPQMLSSGYQDLIGICMRLALADAMYQGEKPFLILDDPFVNLDDAKVEAGKRLLAAVSEEYQTIYFTCHQSRRPADA